jgi:serine/threonine protein phosphatase PrpC
MLLEFWGQTDKGRRRQSNQDAFLMDADLGLFVVADGMGGHTGGEVASQMAIETVKEVFLAAPPSQSRRETIETAYREACRRIFQRSQVEEPRLKGMGTTMVLLSVTPQKIYVANVGDSRAYLYRKPYLWQLTEDHSLMNDQLRSGVLKESQVAHFSMKNVITRSVGFEGDVIVDILERELCSGDQFVLCSDGLSGLVSDPRISEICLETDADKRVPKLIQQALANGGDDNVTVLLVNIP